MTLQYKRINLLYGEEFPEWFDPSERDDYRSKEYFTQRIIPLKEYKISAYTELYSTDIPDTDFISYRLSDIPEWILEEYPVSVLVLGIVNGNEHKNTEITIKVLKEQFKTNTQYESQLKNYNQFKEVENLAHELYEKYL